MSLSTILVEKINNDTLVLPTLPAIALKVRKAADDPDINLNAMGEVIGQDPSLSARMIKIANSAYMGRSVKVTSISQAVTRALAMEQLFVSKNDVVARYLQQEWANTVNIVSSAMAVLQLYIARTKNREMSMDTMTLAALVHNIGVLPILTEAERHPEVFANPTFLEVAIDQLSGRIGASIMREWGFGDSFVNVAKNWKDLSYLPDNLSYIDFVRVGAAVSGAAGSQKDAILNLAIQRGVVEDMGELHSDEFEELSSAAKQIFL